MFADPEPDPDLIDELEDEMFGALDEEEDETAPEGETEEEKKVRLAKEKEEQDSWHLPGIAKTPEDAQKLFKKQKQYIKQLEMKKKAEPTIPTPEITPTGEETIDPNDITSLAMKELGMTDDDLAVNPAESTKKLLNHMATKMIPQMVQKPLQDQQNQMKGDIIKKELKLLYPNFDIDKHEDKVGNIARAKFSSDYIRRNPIKVFGSIIESQGAKKKKPVGGGGEGGEPFAEAPTTGSPSTRAKSRKDVLKGIADAPGGDADLFK